VLPSRPLLVWTVAVLLATAGCRRSPEPSPEFAEAHRRYVALLEQRGEEAYADPGMEQVLAGLARVPEASADATAARELRARIDSERKRLAARETDVSEALEFAEEEGGEESGEAAGEEAEASEPPEEEDAGVAQPEVGMTRGELVSRFGQCFALGQKAFVLDAGMREVWQRRDKPECREAFPGFDTTVLIVEGSRVTAFGEVRGPVQLLPDGGVTAPPGAAPARPAPEASPEGGPESAPPEAPAPGGSDAPQGSSQDRTPNGP
jgi:hypothetical protein